jgi:hypothetical protein
VTNDRDVLDRFNRRMAGVDRELREPTWRAEGSATTMTGRTGSSRSNWVGWLVPGVGLAVALGLLVLTLAPRAPTTSSGTGVSATPLDQHAVTTPAGTVRFGIDAGQFVVRLTAAGVTTELGRLDLPAVALDSNASWAGIFTLVCPQPAGSVVDGYFFGHVSFLKSALSTAEPEFEAPQGVGSIASDGLFLYAVSPGPVASGAAFTVSFEGNRVLGGSMASFDDALRSGIRQPSGCYVLG